jgi:hypothetical protein
MSKKYCEGKTYAHIIINIISNFVLVTFWIVVVVVVFVSAMLWMIFGIYVH